MKSLGLILTRLHYFAPSWVFASMNIMVGTWVLYLPYVKSELVLNEAELGTALFFSALGLLLSIPVVPFLNKKIKEGRSTQVGIVLLTLAFNLPLLAPNYTALCGSLFLIGVFSGFTDISMNAVVSIIEQRDKQNLMSAAHGFFSLGGFLGAGIGSLIIQQQLSPPLHMLFITGAVLCSNLFLSSHYLKIEDPESPTPKPKYKGIKNITPILGLALVAFIVMLNEGAVEHWSTLFLYETVKLPENQAAYGFVLFSLTMTVGRFLGDGISYKMGAIKTLTYGFAIALLGYVFILNTEAVLSISGFGMLGLGLSVVVPEIIRLAGKNSLLNASEAISTVTGIGYIGFLMGPIILGYIANWTSLTSSYLFLGSTAVLGLGIVLLGIRIKN
jgi:fucose permease